MKIHSVLLILLLCLSDRSSAFSQGSVIPTTAPSVPIMKTLDQLDSHITTAGEKRIDVATLPASGDGQFLISSPGSYYLTNNLTGVSGKSCIQIDADNVDLDLNGFALIGVNGAVAGVTAFPHHNLRVHNGSARGWPITGIDCTYASNSEFDHLRVSQNGYGFITGDYAVVTNVAAEGNTIGFGIRTGSGCTIIACSAASNKGGDGIGTDGHGTIMACTAYLNVNGFSIQDNSTIIGCTASENSAAGIEAISNATIKDCTLSHNQSDGIQVLSGCQMVSNNASGNLSAGIRTLGSNNRIDGNHCVGNTSYGVKSSGPTADFIMRNTCFGNGGAVSGTSTVNYSPKAGQFFGPLSNLNNSTVSPWANF